MGKIIKTNDWVKIKENNGIRQELWGKIGKVTTPSHKIGKGIDAVLVETQDGVHTIAVKNLEIVN